MASQKLDEKELAAGSGGESTTPSSTERSGEVTAATDPVEKPYHSSEGDQPVVEQGGRRAWIQVVGGFLAFLNIWGFPLSFGVFQNFYSLQYLQGKSEFQIAWIGTVQNFLVSMVSVLSGPIYDLGYYRTLVCTGSFLSLFGIFMLSLSTQYYEVFLSHLCNGIGSGLLYVPTLALVAQGHTRTRSLAMGIIASGIALGGVIYTVVFLKLQPTVGFAWTVRTFGFIALASYLVAIPCLIGGKQKIRTSGKARKLIDPSAFLNPAWWAYTIAQFLSFWGYLIPMFYIPAYAQVHLRSSQAVGDWLLVAVQGTSLFGRLASAAVAHYTGVLMPLTVCMVVSGVLNLAWIGADSIGGFAAYCVLYGVFSGALIALPPAIFPLICTNPAVQGTWMGMSWAILSLSSLTGSSIAGTFINVQTGSFAGAQIWGGVMLLAGGALFGLLWIILVRQERAQPEKGSPSGTEKLATEQARAKKSP